MLVGKIVFIISDFLPIEIYRAKILVAVNNLQRSSGIKCIFQTEYGHLTQELFIGIIHPSFKKDVTLKINEHGDINKLLKEVFDGQEEFH